MNDRAMGGWRDDGPSPGPSPGRRRGEPRRSFSSRSGGSGEAWRDAIRPVKSAAAKGVNSADALRVAVRNFLDNSCGIGTGFPSVGDATPRDIASDVLLLMRAVNRPADAHPDPPATDHGLGVSPRTLGEAFDALLGDLLTAGKIALDAEVVATLAAYYRARLADPDASTASVNDALKTLAHVLQEGGNHAPPAEVDALFPAILARVGATSRDVSRHALNALGALVSRSPAGTVTAAAHAAAGDAVVAALDRIADGSRGGAFPEDSSASRHLAAATRCAQLCAAPERASWSEATVAALVSHLRRCFAYGVGVGARRTDAERRGGGTGTDLSSSATTTSDAAPMSPSRGGYVPPHARRAEASASASASAAGSSDSDASDAESLRGESRDGDRFGSSRVRANAALCVASLARANPRSLHAHWSKLLPTSAGQLLPRSPTATLLRLVVADPSPRVRAAAAAATAQMLEGSATRQYLAAAEVRVHPKTGLVIRRNFASLSSTLGDVAATLHAALTRAAAAEPSLSCVPAACKALSAFLDAAPFARLPEDLLPKAMSAAWKRARDLPEPGRSGGEASSDVAAARTSLIAALGAALGAKGASARVTEALAPAYANADRSGGASEESASQSESSASGSSSTPRSSSSAFPELAEIIPGLVAIAGDARFGAATRCEAYGALRAAAATHASAVAAAWRRPETRGVLPAAGTASATNEDAAAADRVAQASARFLSEFLLAAGGGAAASASAVGDDEPAAGTGPTNASTRVASPLSRSELVALWDDVASAQLPAMTAHASPLVRAAGLGCLVGLVASASTGVSRENRRALTEAPHASLRDESVAAVRAAACRALGALAALPPMADDPETGARATEPLEPTVTALLASLNDDAKSVRLPASWAVANACRAVAESAAMRHPETRRVPTRRDRGDREGDARTDADAILSAATIAAVARACVDAAVREGDKVRANAARALGHLVAACDFRDGGGGSNGVGVGASVGGSIGGDAPSAWLPEVIQALMSCLTTGNAKVQWNACHAMGALFRNPTTSASKSAWSPLVIRMLLMLMRDTRNFKIRVHAAATLGVPGTREEFGNAYPDTVSIVAGAVEGSELDAWGEDAAAGDADLIRYRPQLAARLTATLLRVLAMGTPEDAGAVRDTLVRKRGVLRRAMETSRAALEEAASLDDALPEDPFGTASGAAGRGKTTGDADGDGDGDVDAAARHDDTAVGGGNGNGNGNGTGGLSPHRTSSMDMSRLAAALSPSRTARETADAGREEDEETNERGADLAAAAAGLARMYAALGVGFEDEVAFYGAMA